MKLRNPWLIRAVALLASGLIRLWMGTIRGRFVNRDASTHPADADRERFIYAIWHETLLGPLKLRARVRILISKHADGELIALVAQWLGFGVVRGSTNRGGGKALVELWDCGKTSHLVITPDGPRGPRRSVQPGTIALASHSGLPIVPVGVGFSRCWRARSWDRFAVPVPFSRVVFVAGEAVSVPPGLDRDALEHYRTLIERRLLATTEDAERLATGTTTPPAPHLRSQAATTTNDPLRTP
ncbi:MAG: lysophospholipid acyltransferase family protein [Isosphaeraceae bacterium]